MNAPIMHVDRGKEEQLGVAPVELESHWVHRSDFAGMGTPQLEHGKAIISIGGHVVPHSARNAKALVEAREVSDLGYERGFEAANIMNLERVNIYRRVHEQRHGRCPLRRVTDNVT